MEKSSREYLERMMRAIQKIRSITFENYERWIGGWKAPGDCSRATLEGYGTYHEPLLFGEKCILPEIAKCLDGEPSEINVMNFVLMLRDSHLYKIAEKVYALERPSPEELFVASAPSGWDVF